MVDTAATSAATSRVAYWLPLITAFIGFATGGFTEWMRDRRAYTREKEARDVARRDAQLERHNEFQRSTLLELQDEVSKFLNAGFEVFIAIKLAKKDDEKWSDTTYPGQYSVAYTAARIAADILNVRVQDERIRVQYKELRSKLGGMVWAKTEREATIAREESRKCFSQLNECIGEVIRGLDRAEISS